MAGLANGKNREGQLVWKFDDDTIVPVRIIVDDAGVAIGRESELVDPQDNARKIEFDSKFKVPVFNSVEHSEIHEQDHYFYSDCITLAQSATQDYLLTVPDDLIRKHLTFTVNGSAGITIAFFEGADPRLETRTCSVPLSRRQS